MTHDKEYAIVKTSIKGNKKMRVLSINPNNNEYFRDDNEYINSSKLMYQGTYKLTPIYPLYTFDSSNRCDYLHLYNEIRFYTMLPIKKLFRHYLVEVSFSFFVDPCTEDSLSKIIDEFNKKCEWTKHNLNVKALYNAKVKN